MKEVEGIVRKLVVGYGVGSVVGRGRDDTGRVYWFRKGFGVMTRGI